MTSLYGPPIDLSGLSLKETGLHRSRRVAFLGRVSTKDNQNPASSIPRQVVLASARLEAGEEFAAYFWDVESGMLPPELRGLGDLEMYDSLGVSTPRDGGLQDLIEQADPLGLTHVLAERSDRVARAMLTSLTVEHQLERLGVEVIYANEPVGGTKSGWLRNRRYGQAEAEIYLTVMKEMSAGGQVQHAVQGYNHGYPPYPYIAVVDESAPVRSGRFGGRPKRRLVRHPDDRRFDTAKELCRLRREEHLSTGQIIAVLSSDPERYPTETPWTYNRVDGLIANPKLSGYQVYNRKASRTGRPGYSRANPLSKWEWSPQPVHEAVVTIEEWAEAQKVTADMRADRSTGGAIARIRAAAEERGLTFVRVRASDSHTLYRIGSHQVVLPNPIPSMIVKQVIDGMERAA
ncbi:recombinase family protein [Streptomyces sp. NPDC001941]|uniref:recombinase family protein n=1 Tax=Streptomyces sp. NPDC001941 TaxID=3154659 RepID=UPI0033286E47